MSHDWSGGIVPPPASPPKEDGAWWSDSDVIFVWKCAAAFLALIQLINHASSSDEPGKNNGERSFAKILTWKKSWLGKNANIVDLST